MAWLHGDTFDAYQTTGLTPRYTATSAATISALHGQCGSQSLKLVQAVNQGYVIAGVNPGDARCIFGAAAYFEGSATLFYLTYGGIPVHVVAVGIDGSLVAYNNPDAAFPPTAYVTPGGVLPMNRETYIEIDTLLGASGTGTVSVWVNGATDPIYTATGLNTAWPGEAHYTGFKLGGGVQGTVNTYFDTLYVLDGTGPAPLNARLGHVGGHALLATGAGATTNWAVTGAAANWNVSDNNTPDPSTIYISTATLNDTDTYQYSDIPLIAGTEVFCVQTLVLAKEDAAGTREVDAVVRQGGTDYTSGTPLGVPTTDFGYLVFPMPENPATSAQWTVNEVNADEFGVQVTT